MSTRGIFKSVQVVFGLTMSDILNSDSGNAVDARGIYCYITALFGVSPMAAAKDIGMPRRVYDYYAKDYKEKVTLDPILSIKAKSVRDLLEKKSKVEFIESVEITDECIRTTIGGVEYKALDMSTCFGASFMGFIDGIYKITGSSLEGVFLELIHNEIAECIRFMTIEQLRRALLR